MPASWSGTTRSQWPALVAEVRWYVRPTILEGSTHAGFISLSEWMFLITVCWLFFPRKGGYWGFTRDEYPISVKRWLGLNEPMNSLKHDCHVCWAHVKGLFNSLMREKQDDKLRDWDHVFPEREFWNKVQNGLCSTGQHPHDFDGVFPTRQDAFACLVDKNNLWVFHLHKWAASFMTSGPWWVVNTKSEKGYIA